MEVKQTGIEGLVEIIPAVYQDDRGWFSELYRADQFAKHGLNYNFVQDNQSFSRKGVIRGLHLQLAPHGQAKLVTVLRGKVLDVVVDLRPGSTTFGKVHYSHLDDVRHNMLMVPDGFAHGFAAVEDSLFFYKCTSHHHPQSEIGLHWNDPDLAINWQIAEPIISQKDRNHATLEELLRKSVISRN